MSFAETVLLGALAGGTIFIGLPFARLRLLGIRARVGLAMFAIGVLAFLFMDVMSHGFALVNTTEGFGIVGPLGNVQPSWTWLIAAGLVAGGPTFLGSMVGYSVNSTTLELLFYAVSGGAILYVIGEVWNAMRRFGYRELGLWLVALGFFVGIATDLIVAYGGG